MRPPFTIFTRQGEGLFRVHTCMFVSQDPEAKGKWLQRSTTAEAPWRTKHYHVFMAYLVTNRIHELSLSQRFIRYKLFTIKRDVAVGFREQIQTKQETVMMSEGETFLEVKSYTLPGEPVKLSERWFLSPLIQDHPPVISQINVAETLNLQPRITAARYSEKHISPFSSNNTL